MPHVAAGKVKILGVASAKPPASMPQAPTIAEGGVPGFDLDIWFGVAAPAKTPPDMVSRFTKEIAEIVALPDVKERIEKVGIEPGLSRRREIPRADPRRPRALRQDHPRRRHRAAVNVS